MSRYRFTNRRDLKKEETVDNGSKRPEGYRGTPREALDRRYGEIGISAVAAAMRYQGDHKAPAPMQQGDHQDEDYEATHQAA